MTMDLNENGTIVVTLPGRETIEDNVVVSKGEPATVTLRLPTLEELLDLWGALDKVAEASRDESGNIKTGEAMKLNVAWIRSAMEKLGTPVGVYGPGEEEGTLRLLRDDLSEPAWFVNGNVAASFIRHWQAVPLGPGLTTPSA